MALAQRVTPSGEVLVYRHPLLVRLAHWVSALAMLVLMLSGLQILNAHPAFYWGDASSFSAPIVAIGAWQNEDAELRGRLSIGDTHFDTTGVLGASRTGESVLQARAFPSWITLPSYQDLAAGRTWHFFFAWVLVTCGLVYAVHGLWSRRLQRMLWPSRPELRDLPRSVLDHIRFKVADNAAGSYNVLQKLAYLIVIAVLVPAMVLTGLAMSPAVDAALPFIGALFGGRQSARTVHFVIMLCLLCFVFVHLIMVIAAGPLREMHAMLTGWYRLARTTRTE